jgi:uncharacterized damage-inducible protein DinB
MTVTELFIKESVFRITESQERIHKCLDLLSEEQVWERPNEASNSVGNLVLHLCGNITQYILSSLGGITDQRNRDQEFSIRGGLSKDELKRKLDLVMKPTCDVIQKQSENDLVIEKEVQGFRLSGVGIIIHVVEHLSYHTGQISYWTKQILDIDLEYYAGQDLNVKNKQE